MLKRWIAILICFLLSAPLAPASAENFHYTFTDSAGNVVTLNKRPEKVAVLFSSYADVWVTAGGVVTVTVGESVERGFADKSAVLVDKTTGHSAIDMETLIAAQPDLVIGTLDYDSQKDACGFCLSNGIPAALFKVERFQDYLSLLKICCDLTGHPENYTIYGTDIEKKIHGYLDAIEGATPAVEDILFIRAGSSARSTKAKTAADHFSCAMLEELGAHNVADDAPLLLDGLSLESIVLADPQYIFLTTMGDEEAAKAYVGDLFTEEGWSALTSVQNGKYVFLPKELFQFKPNARWAEAYAYLIGILYPDISLHENAK